MCNKSFSLLVLLFSLLDICTGQSCSDNTGCSSGSFCGNDATCHEYSCEEWYQFGPIEFTSYSEDVELSCVDYTDGYNDNMNSIVHGCRPYVPGNKAPEAKNLVFFFNQECTATINGDEFTCYQNKPNTDYSDYIAEAARVNIGSCDRDVFELEQPPFWFETVVKQERPGQSEPIVIGATRAETRFSPSFDPSEADTTMYAVLKSDSASAGGEKGEGSDSSGTTASVVTNTIFYLCCATALTIVSLL